MHPKSEIQPFAGRVSRVWLLVASAAFLGGGLGCQDTNEVQLDNPELAAFVRLTMPAQIEIQHYLTKPFDFDGDGEADGLEVILAALDSFGDSVKCIGTFHFDLHTKRMASSDKLGRQIAFWPVTINSDKTLVQYWDRLTRSYCFQLQLSAGVLQPGHYILSARLVTPTGEKLSDSYEFVHGKP